MREGHQATSRSPGRCSHEPLLYPLPGRAILAANKKNGEIVSRGSAEIQSPEPSQSRGLALTEALTQPQRAAIFPGTRKGPWIATAWGGEVSWGFVPSDLTRWSFERKPLIGFQKARTSMTGTFDPLHKWLGISPDEQPPHIYRLLGIQPLENDADVIANAADQRMAYLKSFADGPQAAYAENLLNQIASARLCLLNPRTKALYDSHLKNRNTSGPMSATAPAAAAPAAALPPADSGSLFGQFVLYERTGGGRAGPIFKAKRRADGQMVSLKILPPAMAKEGQMLKRFEREANIAEKSNHPNVVRGITAGEQDGIQFLVLEFVDGADLADALTRFGPLDVPRAINYTQQAAHGLAYLHANNIYHRNIKPQNLLIDRQGRVKVANLTLARIAETGDHDVQEEALTQAGDMLGSADYLAPEQASNSSGIDGRADIYSLGCTMFHLLAGHPPYKGKNLMDKLLAHRSNPTPSLSRCATMSPQAWTKLSLK